MAASPMVPMFYPNVANFVSKRLGNFWFGDQWLFVPDMVWVQVGAGPAGLATPTPNAPQAVRAPPAEPASVWRASARELARNRAAVAALVVLAADRRRVPARTGLRARRRPRRRVRLEPLGHDDRARQTRAGARCEPRRARPRSHADRADLGPRGTTSWGPTARDGTCSRACCTADARALLIGSASALICCLLAALLGMVAGYFGGPIDWVVSRVLDVIWAFPIYLLAISLSVVLLTNGIDLGIVRISGDSLLLPILIIASVYVPYVARPVRGIVFSLKERDFIQAGDRVGCLGLAHPAARRDLAERRAQRADRVLPVDGGAQHPHRVGALDPRHWRAAAAGELGHDYQ